MSGGDATSMVNDPIDDPFDATDFFDTLLADPTYYAAYRENLEKLVEYVENGAFDIYVCASSDDVRLKGRFIVSLPDETQFT